MSVKDVIALAGCRPFAGLTHLNLRGTSVSHNGLCALFSGRKARDFSQLTHLVLSRSHSRVPGSLVKATQLKRLEYLDLPVSELDTQDFRDFCSCARLGTLRQLKLGWSRLIRGSLYPALRALVEATFARSLTHLDLQNRVVTAAGLKLLGEAETMAGLRELGLNRIRDVDGAIFEPSTKNWLDILVGTGLRDRLEDLALAEVGLGDVGVDRLVRDGSRWTPRRLDLSGNGIGPEGLDRLLNGSIDLSRLTHLGLAGNRIDDRSASRLAHCESLAGLRYLDLRANPIRDAGARSLVDSPVLSRDLILGWSNKLFQDVTMCQRYLSLNASSYPWTL